MNHIIKKEIAFNFHYDKVLSAIEKIAEFLQYQNFDVNFSRATGRTIISKNSNNLEFTISAVKAIDDTSAVTVFVKSKEDDDGDEEDLNPVLTKMLTAGSSLLDKKYAEKYSDILLDAISNSLEGKSSLEIDLNKIDIDTMNEERYKASKLGCKAVVFYILCLLFAFIMLIVGLRSSGIL